MAIDPFSRSPDQKPFHSSGYAQAARGDTMGSTSSQSYTQRQRIENNRQSIQAYRDSYVAKGGSHLRDQLRQRMEHPEEEPAVDNEKNDKFKDKKKRNYRFSRQAFNAGGGSVAEAVPGRGDRVSGIQKPPQSQQKPEIGHRQSFHEPPSSRTGYNPYS